MIIAIRPTKIKDRFIIMAAFSKYENSSSSPAILKRSKPGSVDNPKNHKATLKKSNGERSVQAAIELKFEGINKVVNIPDMSNISNGNLYFIIATSERSLYNLKTIRIKHLLPRKMNIRLKVREMSRYLKYAFYT